MNDWLYPFPSFIHRNAPYETLLDEIDNLDQTLDVNIKDDSDDTRTKLAIILRKGAAEWSKSDEGHSSKFMWSSVLVKIAQYPRDILKVYWCFPELLEEHLHDSRSIEGAGKMFQCLQSSLVLRREEYY